LSAHNPSAAYALSGHSPGSDAAIAPRADDHPAYGSVVARLVPPGPLPAFVLTPTYLFDMGFPTPSAGGGWLGRSFDPFPVVRNQMMAASPRWTGELPVPAGPALPADVPSRRLILRQPPASRVRPGLLRPAGRPVRSWAARGHAGPGDGRVWPDAEDQQCSRRGSGPLVAGLQRPAGGWPDPRRERVRANRRRRRRG